MFENPGEATAPPADAHAYNIRIFSLDHQDMGESQTIMLRIAQHNQSKYIKKEAKRCVFKMQIDQARFMFNAKALEAI